MDRKLASIQIISKLSPILEADRIERAEVLGWGLVVNKGVFVVGDKCLYCEIDSLLPLVEQFEFLSKGSKPKKSITEDGKEVVGYRLRTVRLRGVLSQGLALPLSLFSNISADMEVGTELTELLGIYKFDPPIPVSLAGDVKGNFPSFVPKTDEIRIQSVPEYLQDYKGKKFAVTSKMDGTSCTCYKYQGDFNVCSRNMNLKENPNNTFWRVVNQYGLKNKMPDGFAFQAEVCGEGIQNNRLLLKGQDMFVFYVFDIDKQVYLPIDEMESFCNNLGLKTVPILSKDFILDTTINDLLVMADQNSPLNSSLLQEGIVFSCIENGRKISFKVVSNGYLLKYGL